MRRAGAGVAAAVALALAGCAAVGPDYHRPNLDVPNAFAEAAPASSALTAVPVDWWRLYQDPTLDELVARGLSQGTDVRLAVARVEEAAALVREANATLFPEVDLSGNASRAGLSAQTPSVRGGALPTFNNFTLSANTAFELDFWGRLRRLREAAQAQFEASEYARGVVGLTLSGAIARTYFTLRALDAQIVVSQESLAAANDSVAITRQRAAGGIASELDVYQAEGNRAQLASQLKELQRLRAVALHQLAVLTNDLTLTLAPADLRTIPAPPLPPPGLPSTLLERRPDLRQAEATLKAANAQIGVARAQQLPTISLTASLGLSSDNLAHLVSPGATIWSVGVGLLGPVIDWGRYAARTAESEARARQAAIAYEQAMQSAFRDVSDALSNVGYAAQTERDLAERVSFASNSLRLATQRYEAGYSAYLEVLDAQRTLNDAQLLLMRNRQLFLSYTVDLMNALGGGWQA
ncbi:MAG TPA: efflux transporter outer membrane subunit [Casimicrobiaceae bacterium]|nr:efflux transporter outer membrane subunit [Casimicrobiaceae bacterium]